jgi:hypothetical protein
MNNGFIDYCFGALLLIASVCFLAITIKVVFLGGSVC